MRLSIDSPNTDDNQLPDELNKWLTNLTDDLNYIFNNMVAVRSVDVGNVGASISIDVLGMNIESIPVASIQSSTNPVSIQKVTARAGGFDILLDGDPGLSCFINYHIFLSPVEAQGV